MNEVYLITNRVNGKRYVGITCRGYKERFKEHVLNASEGSSTILHNAIRKYGPENFDLILLDSNIPDDQICDKEQYYIKLYNTFYTSGIGYNMTEGGGGVAGYKHSEESKLKISSSLKGHIFPESRNAKISSANKGVPKSLQHRQALSQARLGRFTGEDNPFFGKHHSDHSKSLVSKANSKHRIVRLSNHNEILEIYDNLSFAGKWIVDNKLSSAKFNTCANRINEVCKNPNKCCTAYGYHWAYEKGQSTNI